METLELAREFFKDDKFQQMVGVEILEASNGRSLCKINLNRNHFNADGIVQGGVIYTLADSAFAVAANSTEFLTLTLSSSVQYLAKTTGRYITAEAVAVSSAKKVCFYRVEVKDEQGTLVATANMTGYVKRR